VRLRPFDPYPFIFLNLVLSRLAIQAPVIMMSQNRQEARDRSHVMRDYQVNLKAELGDSSPAPEGRRSPRETHRLSRSDRHTGWASSRFSR
jgi:hypothetical protein